MKTFTSLMALAILFVGVQAASAQTKPVAKPAAKPAAKAPVKPAAKPATVAKPAVAKPAVAKPVAAAVAPVAAPAAPTLISDADNAAPVAASTDALKVRIETNPITKRLVVRTNATGPTRVEVNDDAGRPVLTRDIVAGDAAAVLDVSRLPAGSYIVQCTSGERRGMRRVVLGQ